MTTFIITFILAFCSITYELLLGQALSAFLGNTVLRYSITIALYMFSMGIGAFLAEGRLVKNPVLSLLKTEILLIFFGGLSIIHLHYINIFSGASTLVLSIFSHLLIIVIGLLTGLELPFLLEIQNTKKKQRENIILGINYLGAFLGTIVFAFWFFPHIGLMPSAFFIGILNGLASLLLITQKRNRFNGNKNTYKFWYSCHLVLLLLFVVAFMNSTTINAYFMEIYIVT